MTRGDGHLRGDVSICETKVVGVWYLSVCRRRLSQAQMHMPYLRSPANLGDGESTVRFSFDLIDFPSH